MSWVIAGESTAAGSAEDVTYTATSGWYMWRIVSYRGAGTYSFGMQRPDREGGSRPGPLEGRDHHRSASASRDPDRLASAVTEPSTATATAGALEHGFGPWRST